MWFPRCNWTFLTSFVWQHAATKSFPLCLQYPCISLSLVSFLCLVCVFHFPSIRWRSISSLKCLSCRVSSLNWRRRRTERCRNSGEGTREIYIIYIIILCLFISTFIQESPLYYNYYQMYLRWHKHVLFLSLHLSACTCRYTYLRCIIEKQLRCLPEGATCMWSAPQTVKNPPPQRTTSSAQLWQREWPRISWQKPNVRVSAIILLLCIPASAWSLFQIIQSVDLQSKLELARLCAC